MSAAVPGSTAASPSAPSAYAPGLSAPGPTFRDPAGSLHFEADTVVRTVHLSARESTIEFLDSAFCRRAQARGDLIKAEIMPDSGDILRLVHPRILVATYPWEWTPTQWLAAAELTLGLCEEALDDGWILKDATPLNILFEGTRPIFVDILSFERRDPQASLWLAYGQYVRTFLLPLLMQRMLHWPLALSLFRRDGYEPADCYAALGWSARLSPAAFWPVTLPALMDRGQRQRAFGKPATHIGSARTQTPEITAAVLGRTLKSLRTRTQRALPASSTSQWSDYPASLTHYTAAQSADKMAWVRRALEGARPGAVLDIGANTGEFSALAAELGANVTALERDQAAADRLFRMARERGLSVLAIHADLARPTPAVGWQNAESTALLARLEGQFDLVLMLAVIHHLILMEQIPIPAILALVHSLTRSRLILEWVPASDPMFQSLMRGRDALYAHLTEAHLLEAAAPLFRVVDRHALDNGRVLFLFERLGAA